MLCNVITLMCPSKYNFVGGGACVPERSQQSFDGFPLVLLLLSSAASDTPAAVADTVVRRAARKSGETAWLSEWIGWLNELSRCGAGGIGGEWMDGGT